MKEYVSKNTLLLCLTLLIIVGCDQSTTAQKKNRIEFYGKVTDQFGKPVEKARVSVGYFFRKAFSPESFNTGGKSFELETDVNGNFSVDNIYGFQFFINDIEKSGYVFEKNPRICNYYYNFLGKNFVPDKSKPITFMMRKREHKPDYLLLIGSGSITFKKVSDVGYCDFVKSYINDNDQWFSGYHKDLAVSLEYDKENRKYIFTLKALDENAGIQELSKNLITGPLDGYSKELKVELAVDEKGKTDSIARILYFKGKNGRFYSKINIHFGLSFEKKLPFISIDEKSYTNPYGRPHFEYGNLEFEVNNRLKLSKETKERLSDR